MTHGQSIHNDDGAKIPRKAVSDPTPAVNYATWLVVTMSMTYAGEWTKNGNAHSFSRCFSRKTNAPLGIPKGSWIDPDDGRSYEVRNCYWHEKERALVYYADYEVHAESYQDGLVQSTPADHEKRFEKFCRWMLEHGWTLGEIRQRNQAE